MEQLIEQLTKEQQKQIKRMSTSRIWHQLFKAGYDKVDLESLSRQELMNKLAEYLLWESFTFWWKLCEQKQLQIRETHTVQLKQYLVKVDYNEEWLRNKPRIVVMEIMAEVMLAEEEQDEERRRQDEERRRREEKREQLEKIRKNCQDHDDDETTRSKLSVHFETTTSEVVLQKQQLSVKDELMNKIKQGDTEQQMSDKEADENDEDVEVCVRQVMQMPEIDRRYWVKLLLPLMTQRARTVINRVTLADRDNYATDKEHLLKEFKLTPREYRSKFMDGQKTAEEAYTMFTARLKNLLNYYVKSRQGNDEYVKLFMFLHVYQTNSK